jgi:hypothetical protein
MRRAVRVDCQVVRERDFKLLSTRGVDLSPLGMRIVTREPVLTGEPVIVAFRLPNGVRWFDAEATIVRVVHGRRTGDTGRHLGLAFDSLAPEAQAYLDGALHAVPPPLPMREPRVDYAETVRRAALS